jgi:hypothetical protein
VGVGTTTVTTTVGVGWVRNTADPIVGVLAGSTMAIALCGVVSALFLSSRRK